MTPPVMPRHVRLVCGLKAVIRACENDERRGHGYAWFGHILTAGGVTESLWLDDGHWREDAQPHPLDIVRETLPLQTA